MACEICETRRPRRYCPGVRGDICAICCGTHREETVDCPLDCEYLQDARRHEKPPDVDPEKLPNPDVRVTEDFLREHEELFVFAGRALFDAAAATPGAVDQDIRLALDALTRTYRTMESGLIYESRPSDLVAAAIQQRFRQTMEQFQQQLRQRLGMETLRDSDMLGVLVFLQRLEFSHNNGRKRGRAFLDFLRRYFPAGPGASEPASRTATGGSSLIVP
jgi:hypothetical protein